MKKATYIDPKDLQSLEYDENGNIIIPEGFEIYIKPDPAEVRRERIAEIEKELEGMTEPSEEELIELGMLFNPYHMLLREMEDLNNGY